MCTGYEGRPPPHFMPKGEFSMLLTERDHTNLTAFLEHVLEAYKRGEISKDTAVGSLAHVIGALDQGNVGEARLWFEEGRKFIRTER